MSVEQILFNSGMVGVFVVWAIISGRRESAERIARDAKHDDAITKQQESFQAFIHTQNKNMMTFLEAERKQRREVMDIAHKDFTGGMASMTGAIDKIALAFSQHTVDAISRHQAVIQAVDNLTHIVHDLEAPAHTSGSPS
jgi:hypothetical protein